MPPVRRPHQEPWWSGRCHRRTWVLLEAPQGSAAASAGAVPGAAGSSAASAPMPAAAAAGAPHQPHARRRLDVLRGVSRRERLRRAAGGPRRVQQKSAGAAATYQQRVPGAPSIPAAFASDGYCCLKRFETLYHNHLLGTWCVWSTSLSEKTQTFRRVSTRTRGVVWSRDTSGSTPHLPPVAVRRFRLPLQGRPHRHCNGHCTALSVSESSALAAHARMYHDVCIYLGTI